MTATRPAVNPIGETLFGDMPLDQWPPPGGKADAFPWDAFTEARKHLSAGRTGEAIRLWQEIAAADRLEPRHTLQAWHFLRAQRQQPPADLERKVLGTVVEYAMPEGLDLLAVYADCSARYYNYTGSGVVWEHPDTSMDEIIGQYLAFCGQIVQHTQPWDQPRLPAPEAGHVRFSFLTPGGIHFGQGPQDAFAKDPSGSLLIRGATAIMQMLVGKTG